MMIKQNRVNVVIDGQWGSTGKGKLAGYLYNRHPEIDVSISDFMPNSGHTYVDDYGEALVTKMLPTGALIKTVKHVVIGPYAVIDIPRLMQEIEMAEDYRDEKCGRDWLLHIHPNAGVLRPADVKAETKLNPIASTMTGGMEATMRKMQRNPRHKVAIAEQAPELKNFIMYDSLGVMKLMDFDSGAHTALLEMAQGFDLSLNYGTKWPYVTSRDCLIGRGLDNAGVPVKFIGSIIASLRTLPIRVGSTVGGYSGPCYPDQTELTWDEVSVTAGKPTMELTTVTKRVRRIFTFSYLQLERFLCIVRPDYAFLNFCNYLADEECDDFINNVAIGCDQKDCTLSLLGYGAKNDEMINILDGERYTGQQPEECYPPDDEAPEPTPTPTPTPTLTPEPTKTDDGKGGDSVESD